ncbi:wax ester/triacylglycerol synthase family O-acyltransferase [Ideonella sp. DXS29W]|uniref:diacylglycerol O-acyltransferase n=1 Tax=Ideonella lacteola TaxID=2984193 RepID=A0ABU9BRL8_9BURK
MSASPTVTTERMSRVDTAWLRMDTDANLMMIVGVWIVEPALSLQDLRDRIEGSLLKYDRFRQKVVEDAMGASWVEDGSFDLTQHVVADTLQPRPGQAPLDALKERVGELTGQALDPSRPLWEIRLIEEIETGRSALITRIHHCIGDGISLISVMLSITDGGKPPPERHKKRDDDPDAEFDWFADVLLKPVTDLTIKAIGLYGDGMAKSVELMANPVQPLAGGMDVARAGYQLISDAAAMALMPDDSHTLLKGKATPGKRVAWGEPLPLEEVKAIGQAFGASINDILLTCVAGAIGDYLRAHGDDPAGKEIRAMVPVNLRPLDQAWKLGNRFGLVPLVLPVGIANPIERLAAVRARMNELKGGYQPVMAFALLAVAGLLIKPMQAALLNLFAKKATAVMTNVPGPREPLQFCGRTVKQVMFWVPQSGDIGVGVSILSYAGGVQFGLITDDVLCPDPDDIVQRFRPEFDQLLYLALMLPWGE